MTVLGIKHNKGEYEGKPYENVIIYVSKDIPNGTYFKGVAVDILKVSKKVFDEFSCDVGDTIQVFFDKYGKVSRLDVE